MDARLKPTKARTKRSSVLNLMYDHSCACLAGRWLQHGGRTQKEFNG